jgi:putative ABC transport system permease protein
MSFLAIAWKSIRQRVLASGLTSLSISLGVMLMVIVLTISAAIEKAFDQTSVGYDLIVGAQGSDLQLVLSAVYRIQPPIENVPYHYLKQLQADRRITAAIPLLFGDVTEQGAFPIIGTTPEYFEHDYASNRGFRIRGKRINSFFDAIIGSEAARMNDWDIGSQFTIRHGGAQGTHVHDEKFTVVAVLEPTQTANDRTVFLNVEGFYAIAGHEKSVKEVEDRLIKFYGSQPEVLAGLLKELDAHKDHLAEDGASGTGHDHHDHGHDTPDAMKELTSIFVKTRSAFDAISLQADINKSFQARAVNPTRPIRKLMDDVLGNVRKALVVLTAMIIVVSGVSIFVSIYNSMSDRKREIGIMRALGASRTAVFAIVLAESTVLCLGGGIVGWLVGHGLTVAAAPAVIARTGLLLNPWSVTPWEFILFPILLALATIVGFLPALTAYRTNVADALQG